MKIEIDANGIWYHGSDKKFEILREGSTITQWRELAEAFSHQPNMLGYDDNGEIFHNGIEHGHLYIIDEPVTIDVDIYQHPRTIMDLNAEFLTKRPLKVKLIKEVDANGVMNMIGRGRTAEVLAYENHKVCKLFYEGYPREYVEVEYKNAKEMFSQKINVPEPFEIIRVGNRDGIVYEEIVGKTLLGLMQENEIDNSDRILDEFVKQHRQLLEHHTKNVLSYKEFLIAMVKNKTSETEKITNEIMALPDGDCLLHGDFHPGNILIQSDGTAVIIDFMNVCYGPALYDIARTFYLLKDGNRHIADNYLNKMDVAENDIAQYIKLIDHCRKYEG